jgi:hypothetical protein
MPLPLLITIDDTLSLLLSAISPWPLLSLSYCCFHSFRCQAAPDAIVFALFLSMRYAAAAAMAAARLSPFSSPQID